MTIKNQLSLVSGIIILLICTVIMLYLVDIIDEEQKNLDNSFKFWGYSILKNLFRACSLALSSIVGTVIVAIFMERIFNDDIRNQLLRTKSEEPLSL